MNEDVSQWQFHNFNGDPIDLIPYLQNKINDRLDVELFVGCDSQNEKYKTLYATCVVIHYGKSGGSILIHKDRVAKVKDRWTRLFNEAVRSVQLAIYLKNNGFPIIDTIHLDLNPNPKFGSNNVLKAAAGYVESAGFIPGWKPDAFAATYAADKACRVPRKQSIDSHGHFKNYKKKKKSKSK